MKKVLFATSALVATAGIAAADVTLNGSGRFGIIYDSSQSAAGQSNTKIERRMQVNIDGSGSTDGGLDFGGRIRLRAQEGDVNTPVSAAQVWMGNDTFRISVGNTNGAMLQRIGYYQGTVGLTGDQWSNVSFNIGTNRFYLNSFSSRGNTGDVVRLDFNVAGFGVSLSTSSTGDHLSNGSEDAIAVSYAFGDWTVAAGYASNADTVVAGDSAIVGGAAVGKELSAFSLSAVGSIGDFGVGLGYTDLENVGAKVALSGSYDFGDTTVTGFVANTSEDVAGSAGINAATGSDTEYGIGFTHSLGGAVLAGGVSRNFNEDTFADFGVRFQF